MLVEHQMDIEEEVDSIKHQNQRFCDLGGVAVQVPRLGSSGDNEHDSEYSGYEED